MLSTMLGPKQTCTFPCGRESEDCRYLEI